MVKASERLIVELELLGYLEPTFTDSISLVEVRPVGRKHESQHSPEYLAYLKSPEWRARKKRLSPGRCGGCNTDEQLELHHRCYPPRGASIQAFIDQPDAEFTWFCSICHKAITQSMRRRRKK